ncbi:MAG: putative ABC transporter permease [Eubacteriales bacterium]|nr:putative ABC transporter permease [Eubacteriales bacterium]
MWISRYFVYFVLFSVLGWIYETIYCTIRHGKWENRGFLYGPVCPIYGVGAVAITAIVDSPGIASRGYAWWEIFIISFLGSIVLEYVTSWALEKKFHAYWWDYSNMPLNIHGRVCLPCSIGFGVAGLIVVYGVAPLTHRALDPVPPIIMELLSLIFMGIMMMDLTLTVSALSNFERTIIAMEESLNTHMDSFVNSIQDKTQSAGAMIAEERARFSRENMENAFASMGKLYKSGVQRIAGFRRLTMDEQKRFNVMFETLKKYDPRRHLKLK